MKDAATLLRERTERIRRAIELQPTDRTPTMVFLDAFAAVYTGAKLSKFSTSVFNTTDIMLQAYRDFPGFDAAEYSSFSPKIVAAAFLSKVKLAGKELPEGSLWQIDEQERMTPEDYDLILKMGWRKWRSTYWKERVGFTKFDMFKTIIGGMRGARKFRKAGVLAFSDIVWLPPNEVLMGGRSMAKFLSDLFRMPDKVQAVMDVIYEESIEDLRSQVKMAKPFAVFVGAARGGSSFMAPRLWNRFTWPYIQKGVEEVVKCGAYANLHFDGDWVRDAARFREFPKKKCLWACDGTTDMYAIKEALDGHMCIKGDVPPSLLSLGTPDEVYAYSQKVIRDFGPTGFILAPGCTLPPNSKVENVKAMLAAVGA